MYRHWLRVARQSSKEDGGIVPKLSRFDTVRTPSLPKVTKSTPFSDYQTAEFREHRLYVQTLQIAAFVSEKTRPIYRILVMNS
jgi:hypothetical protein